jgi:WD40 repeat protein
MIWIDDNVFSKILPDSHALSVPLSGKAPPRNKLHKNELPRVEERRVRWNYDSTYLAYAANNIIYILNPMNIDIIIKFDPQEYEVKFRKAHTEFEPNLIYSHNVVFAWQPLESYLATSSFGTTVYIWDIKKSIKQSTPEFIRLPPHLEGDDTTANITCIEWNPEGDKIATASSDFTICIYSILYTTVPSFEKQFILHGHTNIINGLSWNPDGRIIASASSDKTIRIWDITTATQLDVLNGHTERVNSIDWNPDGTQIVSGSGFLRQDSVGLLDDRDGHVFIWDTSKSTHQFDPKYKGDIYSINRVVWSHKGKYIAMCEGPNVSLINAKYKNMDKLLRKWEVPTYFITNSFRIDGEPFPIVTDFDLNHTETKIAVITRAYTDANYCVLHIWDIEKQLKKKTESKKLSSSVAVARAPAAKAITVARAPAPARHIESSKKAPKAPKLKPVSKKNTKSYSQDNTEVCQGCSIMGGKPTKSKTKHNQTVKKPLSRTNSL